MSKFTDFANFTGHIAWCPQIYGRCAEFSGTRLASHFSETSSARRHGGSGSPARRKTCKRNTLRRIRCNYNESGRPILPTLIGRTRGDCAVLIRSNRTGVCRQPVAGARVGGSFRRGNSGTQRVCAADSAGILGRLRSRDAAGRWKLRYRSARNVEDVLRFDRVSPPGGRRCAFHHFGETESLSWCRPANWLPRNNFRRSPTGPTPISWQRKRRRMAETRDAPTTCTDGRGFHRRGDGSSSGPSQGARIRGKSCNTTK